MYIHIILCVCVCVLQELRVEDYTAGRKGPTGISALGGGGTAGVGGGLFGRQQIQQPAAAGGLFGGGKPLGGGEFFLLFHIWRGFHCIFKYSSLHFLVEEK